ncbi:MAG: HlyD family efflux transporter periplasmic adaptor subunit [Phycisphaerae bacterium]|nr:HlyD family efflux transporter periplasmic adaptor subunit [Phycisphaerae bacterium]
MRKVHIAQATLVFGVAVGLLVGLPGFVRQVADHPHEGLILVNGRIEGAEVAVGSKLTGRVTALHVSEGQQVHAGDLIAELESESVQVAHEQALANVAQAQHALQSANEDVIRSSSQLENAKIALDLTKQQTELGIRQAQAQVREAQAAVEQAQALLSKSQTEYDHAQKLFQSDAASELEFTFATDALKAQEAAVRIAEQRLAQANENFELANSRKSEVLMRQHDLAIMESTVRQARAAVGIAEAQLKATEATAKMVEINLRDTKIFAPCDGVVVTRVVEAGEVIATGATVAMLIDFDRLYLKGYLPSQLVGQVNLNDPARVHLDAYPDRHFDATVTQIHQQAEFTPKSVDTPQQRVKLVFGLELTVENAERLVKPGMPADGVIQTDPNAAWKMPADLR